MTEGKCEEFRCPEIVPIDTPDDFCIPIECCPERIETMKYPSPNSCLPEEKLIKLEEKIKEVNKLLLKLALSSEFSVNEKFHDAFSGLVGMHVNVTLTCEVPDQAGQNANIVGFVAIAGKDFVMIRRKKKEFIIPYAHIKCISTKKGYNEPEDEARLSKIDPCFRRNIAYHFGRTVSSSPELIEIFFGLHLKIYLLLLIDNEVKVIMDCETFKAKVHQVHSETLTLCIDDHFREIEIDEPCYYVVENN